MVFFKKLRFSLICTLMSIFKKCRFFIIVFKNKKTNKYVLCLEKVFQYKYNHFHFETGYLKFSFYSFHCYILFSFCVYICADI